MKVNSIGINTYQNLTSQEKTAQKPVEETTSMPPQAAPVTAEAQSSRLAVKAPSGTYADMLSVEERQALEILFSRFKNNENFGATYRAGTNSAPRENTLGRVIDIKV
jgi:hypothetical protein